MSSVANPEISVTDSFFVSLDLLECLCALPRLNKLLHTTRNTPEVIYLIKESPFSYAQGKGDRQCEKNAILKLNEFSSLKAAHEQFVLESR